MKQLHDKGRFPLDDFVKVDPDSVRHQLPEFELYVQKEPETAGILTRKEAGMISEICIEAALRRGQNVLVDGTLRNSTWYQDYFANLRERYPQLQIGILHVTAPREAVISRAMVRTMKTVLLISRWNHYV
jgi:predicted kinase